VAIYLDANVLWGWRSFAESDRLALSIVAAQINQDILIPQVAAEEAAAHYARGLEKAVSDFEAASADLERVFGERFDVYAEPNPWPADQVATWRARLKELATILPLDPDDAVEALLREVNGTPPARRVTSGSGKGGRDAAIWLSVLRDHSERSEEGHLITADKTDFSREGALRPELRVELPDDAQALRYYDGIGSFLRLLGDPVDDATLDLSSYGDAVTRMVREGVRESPEFNRLILSNSAAHANVIADVKAVDLGPVIGSRLYRDEEREVWTINSRCRLEIDALLRTDELAQNQFWRFEDIQIRGSIQFYLASEQGGEPTPQLIDVRLDHTSTHLSISERGPFSVTQQTLEEALDQGDSSGEPESVQSG
jgi:hypothetical protein